MKYSLNFLKRVVELTCVTFSHDVFVSILEVEVTRQPFSCREFTREQRDREKHMQPEKERELMEREAGGA